jgi:hypothetical protein
MFLHYIIHRFIIKHEYEHVWVVSNIHFFDKLVVFACASEASRRSVHVLATDTHTCSAISQTSFLIDA